MIRGSYRRLSAIGAIGLAVLPILTIVGLSARPVMRAMSQGVGRSTEAISKAVALEVTRYLGAANRVLGTLERFAFGESDPTTIKELLEALAEPRPDVDSISLLDSAGIVLYSRPNAAAEGNDYSGRPEFQRLADLAPGKVVFSRPFVSAETSSATVTAWRRIGDKIGSLTLHLDDFGSFIDPLRISPRDRIAVVDQYGRYIAHTEMFFVHEQRYTDEGTRNGSILRSENRRWIVFEATVPEVGWKALYYRDYDDAFGLIEGLAAWVAGTVALGIALALVLAFALRRAVLRPVQALTGRISSLSEGDFSRSPAGAYLDEFAAIDEAFSKMAERLGDRDELISRDLQEKTILLQEIHHRVKNNLQVISSLLNLECAQVRDPADALLFKSSQERVQSMALVHELLYETTDFSTVDLAEYAGRLVAFLQESYPLPGIRIETSFERTDILLDQALSAGLALNELITNALKYGRSDDGSTSISVRIEREECEGKSSVTLSVKDEGPGLPPGADPSTSSSLGFSLVRGLAAQLDAVLEWRSCETQAAKSGIEVRLVFPLRRGAASPFKADARA